MTPQKCLKSHILIKNDPLWACRSIRGYGRKVHAKIWPWGNPWDPICDHFWESGKILYIAIYIYIAPSGAPSGALLAAIFLVAIPLEAIPLKGYTRWPDGGCAHVG